MGQDIFENEMQQVNVAALLRCLDASGNSKVITPASLMTGIFKDNGAIPNGDDLNRYFYGLYYSFPENGTVLNGPSFVRFLLVCFTSGGHVVQLAINVHPGSYQIQYRSSYNNGKDWSVWKSISIT